MSHQFSYRLLLLILLTFKTARRLTTADPNDGACLKNLLQSLEDPAGFLRSWKNSVLSNPCSGFNLHGVTCSSNGRISDLSLNNLFLRGTISPFLLNCTNLQSLDLSSNQISGVIPPEIQFLVNLVTLNLSSNHLSGKFTPQIAHCAYLNVIDLHDNQLSGQIPQQLGLLARLSAFDVSNNKLSGKIPTYLSNRTWYFPRINASSFIGNKGLYGYPLQETNHSSYVKKVAIGVSVGIALLLLLFEALVFLRWFRKRKKNQQANNLVPSTLEIFHEKISYGDLRNATDGFSSRNIVGSGSFGTVFKALLPTENKIIAVKVLNLKRRGAMKSFMAECESLKDIRHRNLVKLLTACSSIDFQGNEFRALIYEFMPNGSLDKWLHPEEMEEIRRPSRTLTLLERLNMAIDVASALDYLHVHCHEPIAHCDLKPSNILLDDDLTAHVSDFGLARLLLKFDQESFFNQLSSAGVRGTIGYAAPEYGMGGQPSIQGDVYSFGVFILEMFTGKRPTNELFCGNFTLHSYIKSALPERVLNAADKSILRSGLRVGFPIAECLVLVFEVGLRCCEESPRNRLAMSEVLKELISIKERFFRAIRTARR